MPVDRFQHSFKESVPIDELLRKEKVKLHFHREGMIIGKGASSKELFGRCERVRLGSSRATMMRYLEKPFVFRGLIKCAAARA